MDNVDCAKQKIRAVIAGSRVPEDPRHADNTLEWLLRLEPDAGDALQLAALAHDIDRANEEIKVKRADFDDYDAFKAAHARNGAEILRPILSACGVPGDIVDEACRLVEVHEVGGDPAPICSRMRTASPISMSTCRSTTSARGGPRPNGDHCGAIDACPHERERLSRISTTGRKR